MPAALRAAGAVVIAHDDRFAPDTPDVAWLTEAGALRWVVLTKDSRIRRHPLELDALVSAGVAAFMLTATGITGDEMAAVFVRGLPRMTQLVRTRTRPFIATVTGSGAISIIAGGGRRGGVRR